MKKIFLFLFILFPLSVSAFAFPDLRTLANELAQVLKIVLNILGALAFVAFWWGVAKFILAAGDSKSIAEGKQFMLYGVLALFILVSIRGILLFSFTQFGFGNEIPDRQNFLPTDTANSTIKYEE